MKATGVVRRIDELGRIVIPKEIRRNLRIKNGDNVEIYTDANENIILKKYSIFKQLGDFAQNFTDAMNSFLKHNIIITDTDNVIAISGDLKDKYLNKEISEDLMVSIKRRNNILEKHPKKIKIIKDEEIEGTYVINMVYINGDVVGLVIILSTDSQMTELEERITGIAAQFLTKYLEE